MLNRLYGWYGKRVVRGALIVLVLLIGAGIFLSSKDGATEEVAIETKLPVVTVKSVKDFGSESNFTVVGTVRAVSEASLQAEASGRITAVNVKLGDRIQAGRVLASIENSREQAALLQAQGAYESAQASSLQSGSRLEEAKVAVRNASRDAFSTSENVVRNLLDEFFSNPTGGGIVGFRLSGTGNAYAYISERQAVEPLLTKWKSNIDADFAGMTEAAILIEAETTIKSVSDFTASIAAIISDEDEAESFLSTTRESYKTRLAAARASLDGTLSSISGARLGYDQAVLASAKDKSTPTQTDAMIKSALGVLRSAQANLEKTYIRTSISGSVNALYVTLGEYISQGQPAAIVANNGALEITTALGEQDLDLIEVGSPVLINDTVTGSVTRIAPAIDPLTGKSEVKISVDDATDLKNGSTVSLAFVRASNRETENTTVILPLKALKMLASGPVVFSVNSENTLVSHPVTLGTIIGDAVVVSDGITNESVIITDARGLSEGDAVTLTQQ